MSYTHANMYYTVNGQVLTREEADAVTLSAKENLYFNEQKVSKEISRRSVDDVDALVHSSKWRTYSITCVNPQFKNGKIAIYQWQTYNKDIYEITVPTTRHICKFD